MNRFLLATVVFLASCGGAQDQPVAPCALPADQSAFSMACASSAYVGPDTLLTVEISGKVSASGTFKRYVQISIEGDRYQGRYISQAGEFRLTQTVTATTFGGPRMVSVGLSSIELEPWSRLEDVVLTIK